MARLDTIQLTSSSTSDGPPTQLAPAAAAALRRKLQRRTVPFLFLVMFLALIDRANLSFAALTMKAELGMTDLQYGFGSSIFYSSYVVMQVPAVWVARRLGAPRTLGIIMFAWGGCAFAFALLPIVPRPISAFYLLRVALGAAEGGLIPVVYYALAQWFAAADLTVAFGQVCSLSAS